MKWINGFYLICIFLCATLSISANEHERWLQAADSLFRGGNWFEASILYERAYYTSTDARGRIVANLAKGEAMKEMGEFSRARRDLQRSVTFRGDESLREELLYQLALCAYLEGDAAGARSYLLQIKHGFEQMPRNRTFLLQGLVIIEEERWDDLRPHLENWLLETNEPSELRDDYLYAFDNMVAELGGIPSPRDPDRARMWSTFLPGAGQFYAGSAGWGVLNAFSQMAALGGFGLMAWNGYYIAGVFAGLGPFQSLYFGGIRQAGTLAEQKNKSRMDEFQAALKRFLLDVAAQKQQ